MNSGFIVILIVFINSEYISGECPKAYNLSDEVFITFEKLIVPKLEVLLKQRINKRAVSDDNYFRNISMSCKTEARSIARANIMLGRMHYISNVISKSRRFKKILKTQPLQPLTIELERLMREGMIQAGDLEAAKRESAPIT